MGTETKNCQNCKQNFVIEPEDFVFYEKFKVPPPTWCQECRIQRRILFRNERKLFRVKDGITGTSILTIFPPESGYMVYDNSYWWSDKWDSLAYGQDFDPSRPFLTQLHELNLKVPKYRSAAINMVNSEYSGNADGLKNCYLLFNDVVRIFRQIFANSCLKRKFLLLDQLGDSNASKHFIHRS